MLDQNVITETKAEHLLHEYQPGAFFLASPHRVLLAKGICEIVPEADGQNQMDICHFRGFCRHVLSKSLPSYEYCTQPARNQAVFYPFVFKNSIYPQ